jgi:uroporphyrinogen decarboxylase
MTVTPKPVLLIRSSQRNSEDAAALKKRGITVVNDPYLVIGPATDKGAVTRADTLLTAVEHTADWLVYTSMNAVEAFALLCGADRFAAVLRQAVSRGLRIAAVGDATARAIHAFAPVTIHCPATATATALGALLTRMSGPALAVLPQSDQALPTLKNLLDSAGWTVHADVIYTTQTVPHAPLSAKEVTHGGFSAVVLRSPSAVKALHLYSPQPAPDTILVCGGPTTTAAAAELFHVPIVTSRAADPDAVADAVVQALATVSQEEPL